MSVDLKGLKLALDANDMSFFHGDMEETVKEMVDHLTVVEDDLKSVGKKLEDYNEYRIKMDDFLSNVTDGGLTDSFEEDLQSMLDRSL